MQLSVERLMVDPGTRRSLVAYARSILRDQLDAEDCVQEALIAALRSATTCDSPGGWLRRIVQNACRMELRARRRARRGAGAVHVPFEDFDLPWTVNPEDSAEHRETLAVVATAMKDLDPADARVLDRHVFDDVSIASIAAENHLTREATKSRILRTRRKLLARIA